MESLGMIVFILLAVGVGIYYLIKTAVKNALNEHFKNNI